MRRDFLKLTADEMMVLFYACGVNEIWGLENSGAELSVDSMDAAYQSLIGRKYIKEIQSRAFVDDDLQEWVCNMMLADYAVHIHHGKLTLNIYYTENGFIVLKREENQYKLMCRKNIEQAIGELLICVNEHHEHGLWNCIYHDDVFHFDFSSHYTNVVLHKDLDALNEIARNMIRLNSTQKVMTA